MWADYMRLWQSTWLKMLGLQAPPVAEPAAGDARFKDQDWSSNFVFDHIKQSYLIAARHIQQAVANVEGLPPESEKKVAFFTRQYVDALAPSNFLMTNPQVLRETVRTGGQNLIRGMNNLLADLEKGGGQLRISMTDESAFQLGRNVATTPGKVVYQTALMQLIQYQPTTAEVHKRPLVIIPPWINKYYILDLREKNSFIRWAVAQGHTVFVISWVNPDARLAQKGFDDYMREGALAAFEAVEKITGEREVNVIGYCLGGTLLGATLGYLSNKNQNRVASATFFVSLLDFSEPGELGVFIDEQQVANLEKKMNQRGYLEGSEMAGTFNLLRANDLVWSFVVNNYLLGKDPFPFDLLYWNADSTRMPARMHSFYLRNMYIRNLLAEPGGIELDGVPIDLGAVRTPAYFISTVEDHIAPWKTTYKGEVPGGTGAIRARRLGPHRRHRQSAGGEEVSLLGERRASRHAGRLVRRRQPDSRLLVGGLGGLDRAAERRRQGAGARAAERPGGRARKLRDASYRQISPRLGRLLASAAHARPGGRKAIPALPSAAPKRRPSARGSPPGAGARRWRARCGAPLRRQEAEKACGSD